MQQAGFKSSEADPCLVYKEDQKGICIMFIYIDDMLIVGKREAVSEAIEVLQQSFEVKPHTTLEDYLGVQVIKSQNGEKAWLGQATTIKYLEKIFDEDKRKKSKALNKVTRCNTMMGKDSFLGSLLVLWKGIAG